MLVDIAPQLMETGVPYFAWGRRPTLFDATGFGTDVTWRALAFLTFTPDGLMTRVVEPACGFGWGYDLRSRRPSPAPLRATTRVDWLDVRDAYASRYPEWTFGGEAWEP